MKKLFFVLGMFLSLVGYSQTAEQIINKHLEITGGIDKWKGFNSTVITGEIILGLNETYPIKIYQQRPNLNKTIIKFQDKSILLNGYNGKKAVQFNYQTNTIEENIDYIPEAFESDLIDYSIKGFNPILLGEERIENIDCYKIKLTKNKESEIYYFDKATYQLIREDNHIESKIYSNFKVFSELTFPCRMVVKNRDEQTEFILILKSFDVNKKIPEKEFKF